MKNNTYFKEGLFFVALITVMILSAGIGIVSLASASSLVINNDNKINHDNQNTTRKFVDFSKFDTPAPIHLSHVSSAIERYRKAIIESGKATTSVMAVYWKIEAADSLNAVTQHHFDSIKNILNANGDELQQLAQPKNISALADTLFGKETAEKQDRKFQMNKILNALALNLNQLARSLSENREPTANPIQSIR